jgi:flagellar biosynthetic protein FliR
MLSITSAQLDLLLATFLLPFARIAALFVSDPILGNRAVPVRIKILAAFVITVAIAPVLPASPPVDPGSAQGLLLLAQNILIGLGMGFTMRIAFAAIEMAGHLVGLQMGIGFASFFDPRSSANVPVVASFFTLFATFMLLATDGHLMILEALVESFQRLPAGTAGLEASAMRQIASAGGIIFEAGVSLSLPVVVALLVTNLSIGVMTRAASQLNIFAVGFPITLGVGMVTLLLTLPLLLPATLHVFERAIEAMGGLFP